MTKKYAVIIGIIISNLLLIVSTLKYPGGSQYDKFANGFDWKHNYICNLFDEFAVNGDYNASRYWAIAGTFFFCVSFVFFFVHFSKKLVSKNASNVIKYCGVSAMIASFLIVTPYHNAMIVLSSTLALISMFYITYYIFKSDLKYFKLLSIICLLISYFCNYIYYTKHYLEFLPISLLRLIIVTLNLGQCLMCIIRLLVHLME